MRHWRMVVVLLSALLVPTVALAASTGKVVIAQGVDPTSLDMMNQQEQPASNVGAQMFESLLERDQSLKLVPMLAAEMPKLVSADHLGVQAAQGRQVPQRRGVQRRVGEVQRRAPDQSGQQAARLVVLRADRARGHRRYLHREASTPRSRGRCSSTTSPSARPRCTRPRSTPARTRPRSRSHRSAPARTSSSGGRRTRRS